MPTAAVKRYWTRLVEPGCLVCRSPAEIAHAHGGSIVERTGEKAKGLKLPRMDWLVLPLCPQHGRHPYPLALDTNVEAWEARYGRQADHIDVFCERHGLDLWALAAPTKPMLPRRIAA